ncbi:MAG: rnc [Rickettsiales bacterium]|jgi:ribonuclease-3|nr:rnc [Rickettsiales bacterium]
MNKSVDDSLFSLLGHRFHNLLLLKEALVHPSVTQGTSRSSTALGSYERFEFLGDAVLGLLMAEFLLEHFPEENEGALAKRHAALVCGEMLASIAREIGIADYIVMAAGEEATGGRGNATNLENVLEALIGALYLDGGLEAAKRFVFRYWNARAIEMKEPPKDPKTALQEWAQGRGKPLPIYTTRDTQGPSHAPLFTIEVAVEGFAPISAQGTSKRLAEREAALRLLALVNQES